jgi:hypothetical protein
VPIKLPAHSYETRGVLPEEFVSRPQWIISIKPSLNSGRGVGAASELAGNGMAALERATATSRLSFIRAEDRFDALAVAADDDCARQPRWRSPPRQDTFKITGCAAVGDLAAIARSQMAPRGGGLHTRHCEESECSTAGTLCSHSGHSVSSQQNVGWRGREAPCVSAAGLWTFSSS